MAFRTIAKGRKTENLPHRTISISKRGIVGFKPSNNELVAYALHKTKSGRIKDLNCFSIFGGLEYKRYKARHNEGIITINLKLKVNEGRFIN